MAICPECHTEKPFFASCCPNCIQEIPLGLQFWAQVVYYGSALGFFVLVMFLLKACVG